MEGMLRRTAWTVLVALVTLSATPAWGQQTEAQQLAPFFRVSSSLGVPGVVDPLLDPNPFLLFDSNTRDLPLQLQAINFNGATIVRPYCCRDPRTRALLAPPSSFTLTLTPRPIAFDLAGGLTIDTSRWRDVFPPSLAQLMGSSTIDATANLRVSVPAGLTRAQSGTFVVTFGGFPATGGDVAGVGEVVVSLIPTPVADSASGCPALFKRSGTRPQLLGLGPLTTRLYALKLRNPLLASYQVGVKASNRGFIMTVDKATGLRPPLRGDEAQVLFLNTSPQWRSLYAVNSGNCAAGALGNVTLATGQSSVIRISTADTTTMVLGDTVQDLGIFSESNFWGLFGGRRITLMAF